MNFDYDFGGNKGFRLLNIYERLNKGEKVSKEQLANDYSISLKSVSAITAVKAIAQENTHPEE